MRRNQYGQRHWLESWFYWTLGTEAFWLGCLLFGGLKSSTSNTSQYLIYAWGALGIPFLVLLCTGISRMLEPSFYALRQLRLPIPSPPEIEASLWQEWGRRPTLQEVAAVEQMLHNQRNRDLVNAGMGFGALYLIARSM